MKILNSNAIRRAFEDWKQQKGAEDPELAEVLAAWAMRIVDSCPDLIEFDDGGETVQKKVKPDKERPAPEKRRGRPRKHIDKVLDEMDARRESRELSLHLRKDAGDRESTSTRYLMKSD